MAYYLLYLCSTQKAEVEFSKSSKQKSSQGRLETKRLLLIVNHEYKERIQFTVQEKNPGHIKKKQNQVQA